MRILVTGGAGALGSSLVDALLSAGHDVVVYDNLSTGKADWLNKGAEFFQGDILDSAALVRAAAGCELIYHLAQQSDVSAAQADPELNYDINVIGTQNVISAARAVGARFIFRSSGAVYGNVLGAAHESTPCNPVSSYGWNMLQAERLCPPGSTIFRFFNIYGPRCRSVINDWCAKLAADKELVVRGTGLQTRDFLYISDAVSALLKWKPGLYNIGSGKSYDLLTVLHMIEQIAHKAASLKFVQGTGYEIVHSCANISCARSQLGWSPSIALKDGIRAIFASL